MLGSQRIDVAFSSRIAAVQNLRSLAGPANYQCVLRSLIDGAQVSQETAADPRRQQSCCRREIFGFFCFRMVKCPACNADVPENNRFCDECGAAMPLPCSACGASNRLGAKFCGSCGSKLEPGTSSSPNAASKAEASKSLITITTQTASA